ncbi:DUF2905 family protein [Methylosinus sp. Sm6]|nr:DUF2905 family protein [Methylosinus sp. Sm6]MBY6240228.1 DUF2905 domain-containing protein [Methylosinus sp. Sm6]
MDHEPSGSLSKPVKFDETDHYIPLAGSLLVSIVLSLGFWLFGRG